MDKILYEMHAEICKIFTSPKRLEIIDLLQNQEKSVSELITATGLSQSNISQHLGILREKGVIAARREGNTTYYRIANPKILEACRLMREVLLENLEEGKRLATTIERRQ
ncbi:MAG: metalloregulator ArsR/SmtB family transcription factor [Candidatus Hydrothermarchaeales archaeon]